MQDENAILATYKHIAKMLIFMRFGIGQPDGNIHYSNFTYYQKMINILYYTLIR